VNNRQKTSAYGICLSENTQCLFLVVLLLLLLSVKLLSAEFAAVSELSDEKFNGPLVFQPADFITKSVKVLNGIPGISSNER